MVNLNNVKDAKRRLLNYNPEVFNDINDSFRDFLYSMKIDNFRHLRNLEVSFDHPVTVISGTNKIGKTSILLLIACSHVNFKKYDSTKPETKLRNHTWRDVMPFTNYETVNNDYVYELNWRKGNQNRDGVGKRLANSRAWSGLAKFSSDPNRQNAKIRDREVRLIDLERIMPARNFSNSLFKKIGQTNQNRLQREVEQAFSYILDLGQNVEVYKIGSHVNKVAYSIKYSPNDSYSSYNSASGEDSLLNILRDIFETPYNSLILIDELEAGFHPSIQRKLADVIQYISWHHKKQFILTTHSPTLMGVFPKESRVFIDKFENGSFESISKISKNAALSKMDSLAHPLLNLYCEDTEAKFIIQNLLIEINEEHKKFDRLVNVIISGPANQVKNDYVSHRKNFSQLRMKIGYSCVFDGDLINDENFSNYHQNPNEFSFFLYPREKPEKFLVNAYLREYPNQELQNAVNNIDHHVLFQKMANIGLAADDNQAKNHCLQSFKNTPEYNHLKESFKHFIKATVKYFSEHGD